MYCKGVKTWKTKKETLNTINVKIVIIMPIDNVFGIHTKLIKMVGVKIILDISEQFKKNCKLIKYVFKKGLNIFCSLGEV